MGSAVLRIALYAAIALCGAAAHSALPGPERSVQPVGVQVAQAGGGRCVDVQLASEPLPAARSLVKLLSPCLVGQVVVIRHAGLAFAAQVDREGRVDFAIPMITPEGEARLELEDGGALAFQLAFRPEDFARVHRVILTWRQPVKLDLHVLEFPSGWGENGHIWRDNAKSFEAVRAEGGGFLESFPAPREGMESHEIYTFWAATDSGGVAQVAVDHADRGDRSEPPYCDREPLAAPRYQLLQSHEGVPSRPQKRRVARVSCGTALDMQTRLVTRPTDDLRVAPAR